MPKPPNFGMVLVDMDNLVKVLRELDRVQTKSSADGDSEIAWIYNRGDVADALGIPDLLLDTSDEFNDNYSWLGNERAWPGEPDWSIIPGGVGRRDSGRPR